MKAEANGCNSPLLRSTELGPILGQACSVLFVLFGLFRATRLGYTLPGTTSHSADSVSWGVSAIGVVCGASGLKLMEVRRHPLANLLSGRRCPLGRC